MGFCRYTSPGCDLSTYVEYMYTYFGAARGAVRSRCVSPIAALGSFKGLQLATHAAPSRRAPPPPLRPAAAESRPVIMLARACAGPRRAAPAAGGSGRRQRLASVPACRLRFLLAAASARWSRPSGPTAGAAGAPLLQAAPASLQLDGLIAARRPRSGLARRRRCDPHR